MKSKVFSAGVVFFLVLFFFSNCVSDKKQLPNTPEKVARQWQSWIDSSQYQLARELSTPTTIEWIDWAEETLKESGEEKEILKPAVFLSMQCSETGDKAICDYLMDDEGYQYRDTFYLQKINGQWLVNIPEEDLIESNELKQLMEEEPNGEKEKEMEEIGEETE
jgi:hypothetical protein